MKRALLVLTLIIGLVSCEPKPNPVNTANMADAKEKIKIEQLMPEIGHGLYRVTINDSTTILIYRGVESCTMIKLN